MQPRVQGLPPPLSTTEPRTGGGVPLIPSSPPWVMGNDFCPFGVIGGNIAGIQ